MEFQRVIESGLKNMNKTLLFDFDGVMVDSEKHYSVFWEDLGKRLLGVSGFGAKVKGATLKALLDEYFPGDAEAERIITEELDRLEAEMVYEYIPGADSFVAEGRRRGWKVAVVTSSNLVKMRSVYAKLPELPSMFDAILTAEDVRRSKPDPDPYLTAMGRLGSDPAHSAVFEDSLNGLRSARSSGATVVGLTTTISPETVRKYSDLQIPDFTSPEAIFTFLDSRIKD